MQVQHHKKYILRQAKGFTLLEMLIVLMIVSVLTSLTLTVFQSVVETKRTEFFLEQFERDLLYAQSYAINHNCAVYTYIQSEKHAYFIRDCNYNKLLERGYSNDIIVEVGTMQPIITYKNNGNAVKSGSFYFLIRKDRYKFVQLLGKGRFYVKKV
ncbi:competence type IV pilus minor pilin ComGD [Bacillus solimangrovi]|uniref:Competence protein ComG n=1 Tax=Bacillus solimangrovi TaxID=1305675 RepID=A0A1E5LFN2_9BACI|nr:competence type IV pilus minor pilin ComGD [Bacillus solimangrovi]OEH92884.1 hypothetical protein BFG57_14500 [Bacillus solimangrovi]